MSSNAFEDLDGLEEGQQYPVSEASLIESPTKEFELVDVHEPETGSFKRLTRPSSSGNAVESAVVPNFAPANWPKSQELRGIRPAVAPAAPPRDPTTAKSSSPKILESTHSVRSASPQQR
jgi:hypothetical protein